MRTDVSHGWLSVKPALIEETELVHMFDRYRRRGTVSAAVVLACLGVVTGCGSSGTAKSGPANIKMAIVEPLSGSFAQNGQAVLAGADLAVKQINAAGGIKSLGGAKLSLVKGDAGSTAQTAVSATRNILNDSSVVAGMGSWLTSLSLATTSEARRANVPWVSESFGDDVTSRGYSNVFDVDTGIAPLTKFMYSSLDSISASTGGSVHSVAIVGDNTSAATPAESQLKSLAGAAGVAVPVFEQWKPPLSDASGIVAKIAAAKVDAIFEIGYSYNDEVLLNQALTARGINVPRLQLGGQSIVSAWQSNASVAKGLVGFVAYGPTSANKAISSQIASSLGQQYANQDNFSGYVMVYVLADALERAQSATRQAVLKALPTTDITTGPVSKIAPEGRLQFGKDGRISSTQGFALQWQSSGQGVAPCAILPSAVAECKPLSN